MKHAAKKSARKLVRHGEVVIKQTLRKRSDGEDTFRETREPIGDLPETPAVVLVAGGITIKTGDFEFARLDVSVSVPCHPNEKSIRRTYAKASSLVNEMLQSERDQIDE